MISFTNEESIFIQQCIFFAYAHSHITEGAALSLLRVDRLEFRDRWLNWLQQNPDIAKATGWDTHIQEK